MSAPLVDNFGSDSLASYTSGGDTPATWTITGGYLQGQGGGQGVLTNNSFRAADIDLTVESEYCEDGGVTFRQTTSNTYYLVAMRDDSNGSGNINVNLYKRIAGTFTDLTAADITWTRGTPMRLQVVVRGSRIVVTANRVVTHDVTDTAITGPGQIGFRCSTSGTSICRYNSVRVVDLKIAPAGRLHARR